MSKKFILTLLIILINTAVIISNIRFNSNYFPVGLFIAYLNHILILPILVFTILTYIIKKLKSFRFYSTVWLCINILCIFAWVQLIDSADNGAKFNEITSFVLNVFNTYLIAWPLNWFLYRRIKSCSKSTIDLISIFRVN
jgi:hypothetical protein